MGTRRTYLLVCLIAAFILSANLPSPAQVFSASDSQPQVNDVPHTIRFSGQLDSTSNGVSVEFSLYDRQKGGTPLWQEMQTITPDSAGRYSVLLGSATADGVPAKLFVANDARWLGIRILGEEERQARVMLVSVPYALKAADAETLGGKPLSAFVLAGDREPQAVPNTSTAHNAATSSASSAVTPTLAAPINTGGATAANYIPKFLDATTLTNSQMYDNGQAIAIGHTSPMTGFDVLGRAVYRAKGTETAGFFLSETNGAVQAFIGQMNTKASDPIAFWHGGNWRMIIRNDGRVGVGTITPNTLFDVAGRGTFRATSTETSGFWLADQTGASQAYFGQVGLQASDPVGIYHSGVWRVVVDSTGRMGLGTTAPKQSLDVSGRLLSRATSTLSSGMWLGDSNGAALAFVGQQGPAVTDPVGIYHGGWRLTVASTGAVGIGTTQPQTPLDVTGTSSGGIVRSSFTGSGSQTDITAAVPPSGIVGTSTAISGVTAGVYGSSASPLGAAIAAMNSATSGSPAAVDARVPAAPNGVAVYGEVASVTGSTTGVYGVAQSTDGYGIEGDASSTSGVAIGVAGFSSSTDGRGVLGRSDSLTGATHGVRGIADSTAGTGISASATSPTGQTVGLKADVASAQGIAIVAQNTSGGGDLFVGRRADGTNVARVDAAGNAYFNTTNTGGADFAEAFAVTGPAKGYAPGDVMSIDTTSHRRLRLADASYSRTVAGIYSTKPGLLARPRAVAEQASEDEIPLAVIGVVPCKVTTKNGAIAPGDLLVASDIPGHAMKGTDLSRMIGAVIGKALQSLETGEGVIDVLVTLQ